MTEPMSEYDKGYADAIILSADYVTAVRKVQEALNDILAEKMNYDRMQGYEIHENDGQRELARTLLTTISDALEGRP